MGCEADPEHISPRCVPIYKKELRAQAGKGNALFVRISVGPSFSLISAHRQTFSVASLHGILNEAPGDQAAFA